jgi:hypothetical protein
MAGDWQRFTPVMGQKRLFFLNYGDRAFLLVAKP